MWQIHPEPVNLLQYLHRIPLCFYAWIPIPPYALSRILQIIPLVRTFFCSQNILSEISYKSRSCPLLPPAMSERTCARRGSLKVFRSCVPVIRHSFADNQACQNKQSLRLHRKTLPYENAYNPNKPVSWKVLFVAPEDSTGTFSSSFPTLLSNE